MQSFGLSCTSSIVLVDALAIVVSPRFARTTRFVCYYNQELSSGATNVTRETFFTTIIDIRHSFKEFAPRAYTRFVH